MYNLIGIAGKAGSGKTTAAEHLVYAHNFTQLNFADPLKVAAAVLTGLPLENFYNGELKKTTIPWLFMTHREFLQKLGTDCIRDHISRTFWTQRMEQTLTDQPTVIGDVRFFEEARMIRKRGGIVIEVQRESSLNLNHPSEDIDFNCDFVLNNNDEITHLELMLDYILEGRVCPKRNSRQ